MADPVWLTAQGFPQKPQYDGWVESLQRNVNEYKPDVGAALTRRRSSASHVPSQAVFKINAAQREAFEDWFRDEVKDGTLPYLWNHPTKNTQFLWLFQSDPQISPTAFDQFNLTITIIRLP